MLQVLACLLAGHTAKETAELLDVSVHTVQEHIRRLYKRSGTRNRAELAECYRHVAPTLTSMTLDELPISPENVNHPPRIELDGK
ncbi:MAG TPA: helix-turn-helix transcriptional regulator [Pirellulaceae bacterium]|nr:helix-turn-helix transcriptional regulator [Pirellulaceae bacterium]